MKKNLLSLLLISFISIIGAYAQSYVPDSTFGGTGLRPYNYFGNIDRAFDCLLQPNGKLIVVGLSKNTATSYFELCFTRFNEDGSFDATFGSAGTGHAYVPMGNQGSIGGMTPRLAMGENNSIIAVNSGRSTGGTSQDLMVCRLDSTGHLDNTFNSTGVLFVDMTGAGTYPDQANAVAVDPVGNIWACGVTRNGGTPLDNMFALIKVKPNGTLDTSFDTDGKKLYNPSSATEFGRGIAIQSDGKIVFGGNAGNALYILRIDSTGAYDGSFNVMGYTSVSFPGASNMMGLAIDSQNRIIVVGDANSGAAAAVARFLPNGSLDQGFGTAGVATFSFGGTANFGTDLHILSNDQMIIGGYADHAGTGYDFMAARIDTAGAFDLTFNTTGYKTQYVVTGSVKELGNAMAVTPDQRIYIAGTIEYSSAINEDVGLVRIAPVASSTGIAYFQSELNVVAYPQPFAEQLTIAVKKAMHAILLDVSGRVVMHLDLSAGINNINTQQLESGVYFLSDGIRTAQKLIRY